MELLYMSFSLAPKGHINWESARLQIVTDTKEKTLRKEEFFSWSATDHYHEDTRKPLFQEKCRYQNMMLICLFIMRVYIE